MTQVAPPAPLPDGSHPPFFDWARAQGPMRTVPRGTAHHFEDYIYVLCFGSLVKVGITKRPQERLSNHRNSALARRGNLVRVWISSPHLHGERNEDALIAFCSANGTVTTESRECFTGIGVERVIAFARTLPFERFDAERREQESRAAAEERRQYTARTGFGSHLTDFFDDNFLLITREKWERTAHLAESSVEALFQRDGETYTIPQIIDGSVPSGLLEAVARVSEWSIADLLALDYIGFLEVIGRTLVRAEAAKLRRHAEAEGRPDLLRRIADHGSLKPSTDFEPSTSPRS